MEKQTIQQREQAALANTYGRFDIVLDHGKDAWLWDDQGNQYIDLTSGIGVNVLGHQYKPLTDAIKAQADRLMQASNLFYTEPMVQAAEKLKKASGMEKVFFSNSGAESNEGAIKTARKYSADKYGPQRTKILTLKNSFHGRTVASLEATGQDKFHQDFYPFTGGFDYIEPNDIEDLKAKADPAVCAVMMELIQGESGVRPLDKTYVKEAEQFCKENDILLIIDEVQTGVGRTGTFYAFQQFDIEPDIVTSAKALAGGIPMGAVLFGKKTASVLGPGQHGTTFGGNPLASAAASVVIETVDDETFLHDVQRKGDKFIRQLKALNASQIRDVRGMGLMIGIEVPEDRIGQDLTDLQKKGVLALKAGTSTIRLLPPLVITDQQIEQAVQITGEVLK